MRRMTWMALGAVFAMLTATFATSSIAWPGTSAGVAIVAAQEAPDCSGIVANGDFESPEISGGQNEDQQSDADFWDGDYWLTGYDPAYSGNQSVYIREGGDMSQTLDTSGLVAGDTITISFQHDLDITASLNDSSDSWTGGTFEEYQPASVSYTLTSDAETVTLTFAGTVGDVGSSVDYVTAACSYTAPTPTTTPTLEPTETATTAPTVEPSATTTATIESTATSIATTTPTVGATETPGTVSPTTSASVTPTMEMTAEPTTEPTGTGSAAVTLSSSDGGAIPDDAIVCVGDACQSVGSGASAAAVSGTTLSFDALAPGTYPVTVTGAAPYADATASVTIVAGSTSEVAITLQLTVAPTQPGA
ncbi:MAG TPA: hypothetical protein VFQ54_05085, partial [Thermomicrobiales bacterium]|nr:hypothetical protein [Thermomicrobiales bacterium]